MKMASLPGEESKKIEFPAFEIKPILSLTFVIKDPPISIVEFLPMFS